MSGPRDRALRIVHAWIGSAAVATTACSDDRPSRRHHDDDEREVARGTSKDAGTPASTGYAVVDPMPTPARCAVAAAETTAVAASFEKDRDLTVTITPAPARLTAEDLDGIRPFGVTGKPVVSYSPKSLELKLTAAPTATSLSFIVPLRCDDEVGRLLVVVDWSTQGTAPHVMLTTRLTAR